MRKNTYIHSRRHGFSRRKILFPRVSSKHCQDNKCACAKGLLRMLRQKEKTRDSLADSVDFLISTGVCALVEHTCHNQ